MARTWLQTFSFQTKTITCDVPKLVFVFAIKTD